MTKFTSLFSFPPLGDGYRDVRVHYDRELPSLKVRGGDIPKLFKPPVPVPEAVADVIDIATAILVADRFAKARRSERRRIHVELPLRYSDHFGRDDLKNQLAHVLLWYTGDLWTFSFRRRDKRLRRLSEIQLVLPWSPDTANKEVCLWSGGLDSAAGLVTRSRQCPGMEFFLFGYGSSRETASLQRTLADKLHVRLGTRVQLAQIVIRFKGTKPFAGYKNTAPRARSLAILLSGCMKAFLEGQRTLFLYENGIGAINLSFPGGIHGLDHARAVHPKSLRLVENYVSAALESPFEITNPFVYNTKGWMCESLRQYGLADLIPVSVSCDRKPRNAHPRNCGQCSSCLLRRQSLCAAGIVDTTNYATLSPVQYNIFRRPKYLHAMEAQVQTIRQCLLSGSPWNALVQVYPELEDAALALMSTESSDGAVIQGLLRLLSCYVQEWHRVGREIGAELRMPIVGSNAA